MKIYLDRHSGTGGGLHGVTHESNAGDGRSDGTDDPAVGGGGLLSHEGHVVGEAVLVLGSGKEGVARDEVGLVAKAGSVEVLVARGEAGRVGNSVDAALAAVTLVDELALEGDSNDRGEGVNDVYGALLHGERTARGVAVAASTAPAVAGAVLDLVGHDELALLGSDGLSGRLLDGSLLGGGELPEAVDLGGTDDAVGATAGFEVLGVENGVVLGSGRRERSHLEAVSAAGALVGAVRDDHLGFLDVIVEELVALVDEERGLGGHVAVHGEELVVAADGDEDVVVAVGSRGGDGLDGLA